MSMKPNKEETMTKATKKQEAKVVTQEASQEFMQFWNKDGQKTDHNYLIPASIDQDGKAYANISFSVRYSKAKDTLGVVLELGNTGKQMYIGASTKKLGRVYISKPKVQEDKSASDTPTVL